MDLHIPTLSPQQLVERHINAHPGCTVRNLLDHLMLTPNQAWTCIKRLRAAGRIRRVYIEGERRICWEPGQEPDYVPGEGNPRDGQMNQSTVSTWEAIDCAQQTWISSLLVNENN